MSRSTSSPRLNAPAWPRRGWKTPPWRSCASGAASSRSCTRLSTIAHAGTGFEVHGSEGSIIARDVMTQRPIGTVVLRNTEGETPLSFTPNNLYERSVRCFNDAVRGRGSPAATGEDGVRSLALALAVREAAARGTRVAVEE